MNMKSRHGIHNGCSLPQSSVSCRDFSERISRLHSELCSGQYYAESFPRIEVIERSLPLAEREEKGKTIQKFVDELNKYAKVPITSDWYVYLSEIMTPVQDKPFMRALTMDKSGDKFFLASDRLDPSQPQLYMNIDFLIRAKGNEYVDFKADRLRAIMPKTKVDPPLFNAKLGKVEEGNHRIKVAKELGATSVPVMVFWK